MTENAVFSACECPGLMQAGRERAAFLSRCVSLTQAKGVMGWRRSRIALMLAAASGNFPEDGTRRVTPC